MFCLKKSRSAKTLFNFIAPVYGAFYGRQKRYYIKVLDKMRHSINFSEYKSVIDVGCGTGALCSALNQQGLSVTGIDQVQKMLDIAVKKEGNESIQFLQKSVLERLPYEDKNFDISIASFLAHGLKAHERKILYAEMNRVTKHFVIIYDYIKNKSLLIKIIERLEGGDYFNFIKHTKNEMRGFFHDIRTVNINLRSAWYICAAIRTTD